MKPMSFSAGFSALKCGVLERDSQRVLPELLVGNARNATHGCKSIGDIRAYHLKLFCARPLSLVPYFGV
jgi:hypothetical protein